MSNTATAVETYTAMRNETDPERRRELVADTVTDDASPLDPMMTARRDRGDQQ
jgi:hypothetical protein